MGQREQGEKQRRGHLAAVQGHRQLLDALRHLLVLGVAELSLLLQGPFFLLEADVVLCDLGDLLY